ncbi:thiamine-monophosphate kinase [Leptospira sp. 201903070]|uniref:Thiamine-monophosphate kinase n=1 Tax=Leptospira ainlahdjerensis TaxID=2810033 RepID=A0ABS2UBE8_9LEPT|nr:thiamine-phosphate kinase [Leptospira ainlahdjerensis]MBM9577696.1 thiamine-monophosphate kinase [Leptospira ainlahdjerensis]MBM9577724.1 thiamine-monophosphate kinase [Leptospira ainlahdjerensis]
MKENSNLKESEIIRALYPPESLQTDDCYLDEEGRIYTTDTICEGTHFRIEWSGPREIAKKLVEVNVSDIAAGGGVPTKAFLNLGLSPEFSKEEWILPFSQSLETTLSSYGITLCGGDTYRSPSLNLTLTLVGTSTLPWKRSGGKLGDFLYLSGAVGLSQLGYKILNEGLSVPEPLRSLSLEKHLSPKARLKVAQELSRNFPVSSCMDLTDGLLQDLPKLSASSELGLEIFLERIPSPEGILSFLSLEEVLSSGEELELLFLSPFELPNTLAGISITKIGATTGAWKGVRYFQKNTEKNFEHSGFEHFEPS